MATGATRPPQPALVSTIKLRQAGFSGCVDTEQMFRELLASLAEKSIVPMPGPLSPLSPIARRTGWQTGP
jgi:hypothetical protein